ncbi:MAG: S8 family serine peptidase [Eubacteriales bacterium]|nr:S8 family serine peptidase [Eubacteriales bacterium]
MKKVITLLSTATVLGLGFVASRSVDFDAALGDSVKKAENTYIVEAEGNPSDEGASKTRNEVLNEVKYLLDKDSYEITFVYDTVFNGFSIKTTASNAKKIASIPGVSDVQISHTYARPEAVTSTAAGATDDEIKAMKLGNYSAETMKATADDIKAVTGNDSFGGRGVTIGIADTGLFLNQVAGTTERNEAEKSSAYGSHLNAAAFKDLADADAPYKTTAIDALNLGHKYTHINNKIFYAYDYADKDTNVNPAKDGVSAPTVEDNIHGTHVASLSAANGDEFQGIAPNAQVAVLKVFGDNASGASSDAIIGALNDAAKMKLDIVNLSLGSDLYSNDDSVDSATYKAAKACYDVGTIVNFAAGNSGKSTYSSSNGYSDWTTDTVETGIVGGDALYDEVTNVVASSNPDKAYYSSIMLVKSSKATNSSAIAFKDQVVHSTTQTFDKDRALTDLLSDYPDNNGQFDYVYVPGYGSSADYQAIGGEAAVKGKIAVVNRGNLTFVNKTKLAENNGAIALIVINNDASSTFNFSMDFANYSPSIPVCFVFQSTIPTWGSYVQTPKSTDAGYGTTAVAGGVGTINIAKDKVEVANDGNIVSSFSNDGPAYNLDFGPTIAAPGGNIMGAVNAISANDPSASQTSVSDLYGYEFMSGTSMATPNLSGAMALVLGEKNPDNNGTKKASNADDYLAEKKKLSMKAMATADQLDDAARKTEASPRMQGAGRINASSILKADSYITTKNNDLGGFENEVEAKAELKNKDDLYVENGDFANTGEDYITFDYTIHNDSDTDRTYTPTISVMIPSLRIQETHESYAAEETSSRSQTVGYDSSVTFNKDDLSTYPTFIGYPTMSVNDDNLTNGYTTMSAGGTTTVTVKAGETATATAKIRIDNLKVNKDWGDSNVANVENMDLKDYLAKYFKDAGGTYVEGFLKLTPTDTEDEDYVLTMPYMGFYGDYTVGKPVEDFDFEKDSKHIYNSDLVTNYLKNLNAQYAKPNNYAGSTLSASGAALSESKLTSAVLGNSSLQANGNDLLSLNGASEDKTHLYAGATKTSDVIHASFFVNRSLSSASWTLTKGTTAVSNGTLGDLYLYSTNAAVNTAEAGIEKSWVVTSGENIVFHRAYGEIDISKVAEGDYTLAFNFVTRGTGKTYTKSYTLTVDKTAPQISSISTSKNSSGKTLVELKSKGAATALFGSIAARSSVGSDGVTTFTNTLSTNQVKNDKVLITLEDYAHNASKFLIHPSDLSSFVGGSFLTSSNDFHITEEDPTSHYYTVSIVDSKDNDINITKDYYVYVFIASGLSKSDVTVKLSNVATDDFTYDSASGLLVIHMSKDDVGFELSTAIVKPGDSTSSTSSTTSSTTSSSSNTTDDNKKGGCFGSVAAASTIVGALALLGTGLALKKKREDK